MSVKSSALYAICAGGLLFLSPMPALAEECSTPLPSDVIRPRQEATEGNRAFIGVWGSAKWDGVLCHTLVIESLPSENVAAVVYSHGVYARWNIRAPAFVRFTAQISDGVLRADFPTVNARVEYRLVDGKLEGKYFTRSGVSTISLARAQ